MTSSATHEVLREIPYEEFAELNPIPQAVLDRHVRFLEQHGIAIIHGTDDLDEFEGAALAIGNVEFALLHYAGYPKNTTTLYLPRRYEDVSEITEITLFVLEQFNLPAAIIAWQRADEPNL